MKRKEHVKNHIKKFYQSDSAACPKCKVISDKSRVQTLCDKVGEEYVEYAEYTKYCEACDIYYIPPDFKKMNEESKLKAYEKIEV